MLTEKIKAALKANWGDPATALNCYAEVKFIDSLSSWSAYIIAMDAIEETYHAIIYSKALGPETGYIGIQELHEMFNEHGEHPIIDPEYRRTRANEILRRLS